jgi:predicted adenylyl cyclase CyaB
MIKSTNNIEVEIRSFVTPAQYRRLVGYLQKQGKPLGRDRQVTYYFSGPADLRIQKNSTGSKIWLKSGQLHDRWREELEIHFAKQDFAKLEKLFAILGFAVEIKWYRQRRDFIWKGIKVSLDRTKGYGLIIELEKMASPKNQMAAHIKLKKALAELGVVPTPKSTFEQKFEYYKNNWRKLIK